MSDVEERLRERAESWACGAREFDHDDHLLATEAADKLEAQADEIARLRTRAEDEALDARRLHSEKMDAIEARIAAESRASTAEALLSEVVEALEPFASFGQDNTASYVDGEREVCAWAGNGCHRERVVDWFGPTDFRQAASLLTRIKGTIHE